MVYNRPLCVNSESVCERKKSQKKGKKKECQKAVFSGRRSFNNEAKLIKNTTRAFFVLSTIISGFVFINLY